MSINSTTEKESQTHIDIAYQFRELIQKGNALLSDGRVCHAAEVFAFVENQMLQLIQEHIEDIYTTNHDLLKNRTMAC